LQCIESTRSDRIMHSKFANVVQSTLRTLGAEREYWAHGADLSGFVSCPLIFPSNVFSASSDLTASSQHAVSDRFTETRDLTNTDAMPPSNDFLESNVFSHSVLSPSDAHLASLDFETSDHFSESSIMDKSKSFGVTSSWTNSHLFVDSLTLRDSAELLNSRTLILTDLFKNSQLFDDSTIYPGSAKFAHSGTFSKSHSGTLSPFLSDSIRFHHSASFTNSGIFARIIWRIHTFSANRSHSVRAVCYRSPSRFLHRAHLPDFLMETIQM
jgi:hypothetical protein